MKTLVGLPTGSPLFSPMIESYDPLGPESPQERNDEPEEQARLCIGRANSEEDAPYQDTAQDKSGNEKSHASVHPSISTVLLSDDGREYVEFVRLGDAHVQR